MKMVAGFKFLAASECVVYQESRSNLRMIDLMLTLA